MRHAVRSIVNLPLRVGVLLFGIVGAPAAPAATPGDEPWQLAAAASAPGTSVPAGLGKESLLFWSRLQGPHVPAESAHLLVQAPYATVKAAVSAALRGQGPWQAREAREPLSELPEDWAPVLLSRRADLRAVLAAHAPELEAAVAAGALTADEARQRQQQARGRVDASPAQWRALAVFGPTGAPPPAGGPWPFATVLRAPRQALMERAAKGNTLLWPVRLRDPQALWIEDAQGLAALDPANGRVQRAFALPQRFGAADPDDASGTAQWVPTPLGSLEGRWIATGFVLMLPEPPDAGAPVFAPGAGASARLSRFVGMHVVDSRDGQVRVSALLGEADSLGAAARSAHGRLLALGADGPSAGAPQVALWPLAGGGEPLRLEVGPPGALAALAFSWDGTTLWALGDRGLLRWTLPAALRDAADADAYPEHSRD